MRKYLATLHKRPHHHKRRFALLTSGAFTLLIFGIWVMVSFPPGADAELAGREQENKVSVSEANPFGPLGRGFAASFAALRGQFGELKKGLEVVDFSSSFEEMKDNTLETYGQ